MKKLHLLLSLVIFFTFSAVYANANPPENDPPVITISGNTTICPGGSTTLTASGATNYHWAVNGPAVLPADNSNNVALAVGLHKLRSAYSGPAMQVRRGSDNQVQDIGFTGNDLDIAAINAFLGSSPGYCTKLYDQSGNNLWVTQADNNAQPLFIGNGLNGRPALKFTTTQFMNNNFPFSTPYTIVSLARQTGPARERVISARNNNWLLGWWGGYRDQAFFQGWLTAPSPFSDSNPYMYSASGNGGGSSFYRNGTLIANNSGGTAAPNGIQLNGWGNSASETSDCEIMDIIIFNTVLPDGDRNTVEALLNDYYYNTELSGATLTVSPATTTTYTVMGSDANGSNVQTVTVTVGTPAISCPANISVNATTGNCSAIANFNATATGNEPISFTYSQNPGTSFPAGSTAVNAVATDVNGCTSSCTFNVVVGDVDPPQINCPTNINVLNNPVVIYNAPTVTDCLPILAPGALTFNYTGALQTFTVPAGVSRITIDAYGAGGTGINYSAGKGGRASGELTVTAGQVLNIYVGGAAGYNGGGLGKNGANGGGASDVRVGGTALTDRVIVAGGGGGAGGDTWFCTSNNANGGGGTAVGSNFVGGAGGNGYNFCGTNGGTNGGSSSAGYHGGGGGGGGFLSGGQGATDLYQNVTAQSGSLGQGGNSSPSPASFCAIGGGGGGYYGGGGAAGNYCGAGQGGGGSSWTGTLANPLFYAGVRAGDGVVVISFLHGTIVQTAGLPSGSDFPIGTTTNTFLATDVSGNTSTCSFDVTVTDNQPPTLTFPGGNIHINADPGQCTAVVNYPLPTVEDNICNFADSITGYTVLGNFNGHRYYLSTNSVTWQQAKTAALSIGGKLVSVTSAGEMNFLAAFNKRFWIGLTDEATEGTYVWESGETYGYTNWSPGEPNNSGNEDYIEMAGTDGKWNDLSATGINPYVVEISCGIVGTLVSGPASGATFPLGSTTVTWSATDGGGNSAQASFTVTVSDNQAPVFTACSPDVLVNVPAGQCSTNVTPVTPTVTDCSPVIITNDHPSTSFSEGVTVITWTATDTAGKASTCTSTVTVHAPGAPVITSCPPAITVNNATDVCGAVVNYSLPTFTDDCSSSFAGAANFNYTGSVQKFVVPAGVTTIHISATGAAGGGDSFGNIPGKGAKMAGDFNVIPGDTLYLMIGQQGQTGLDRFGFRTGGGGAGGTFITKNAPSFNNNLLIAAGGGGGAGAGGTSNANTGTAGFNSGNGGAYGAAIGGINGNGGGGAAGAGGAGWLMDGNAYDCYAFGLSPRHGGAGGDGYNNCSGVNGGYGGGGGSYFGAGGGGGYSGGAGGDYVSPNYEIGTYGGGGGSYNAGVNQVNAAGIGNGNGEVSFSWTASFPAVYVTSGLLPGSIFPIGTTINNFTVADASGNISTCSMSVTVLDIQPPVITCTNDTTVNVNAGQCTAMVNYNLPVANDNCGTAAAIQGFVTLGTLGNHNYYLSDATFNWTDARLDALSRGGVIACINSATENDFLADANPYVLGVWLGGFQNHSNPGYTEPAGGWEWMDGTAFNSYTAWNAGEPNDVGGEDYIQFYSNLHSWNDAFGGAAFSYILEIPNNISLTRISGPASGAAFPIGTTTITYKATDPSGNFSTCSFNVTVNGIPTTPGNISGPTNVCPYINTPTQLTYSIPPVTNATGYLWTVPPTVSIVSGQGTDSIRVTIGAGFVANANKVIKVRAVSSCGNSADKLIYLLAQFPNTPAAIVASSNNVCPSIGTNVPITYTVPKVTAAAEYIWTAPAGTTVITHPNGTGVNDTTISVTFSNGFVTGNITAQAVNDCGTSGIRSIAVTRNNPSTPSLISGPTNACAYIAPGGVPASYSAAAVAGNTYSWTVPAAAIGLTGQGSGNISFTFPPGFVSGSVGVTATNGCGTSGARTLAISKLNPATPSVIDVIQTQSCPGRTFSYTLSSMPANAVSVQWTVPANATSFTGQGTTSITVNYPDAAVQGTVTATAVSNCGSSVPRSATVKLPACPSSFSKGGGENNNSITLSSTETLTADNKITVMPNPTTASFSLTVNSISKQPVHLSLMDASGKKIKTMNMQSNQTIRFGSELQAGIYLLEIEQDGKRRTERIIKL